MVGRITKGANLYGALEYNARKVEGENASVLFGNKVIGNDGPAGYFRMNDALQSFAPYLETDHRAKRPVFHVSLNPDPRDRLSDEQFAEIAREYMDRMGFAEQPYYVFKHRDIDRQHIHIVSCRVREDGTTISDSTDYQRSKAILRDIEQRYNLHPAVEGEEKHTYDRIHKIEYGRDNLKQQMRSVTRQLAKQYSFGSLTEFRTLLNLYNIDMEERKGEINGKRYHGLVYSPTDESGKWLGQPFKASALSPEIGAVSLEKQIERNARTIASAQVKQRLREHIAEAMRNSRTTDDFKTALQQAQIDVVLRRNNAGRITGATFIDHLQQVVFNGSRLGKQYSANRIDELFNNPATNRNELLLDIAAKPTRPRMHDTPASIPSPQTGEPHADTNRIPLPEVAPATTFEYLAAPKLSPSTTTAEEMDQIREQLVQKKKKRKKGIVR